MCKQRVHDVERMTLATHDEQRQAFIGHAVTFALVIGGLAVLNLVTSPHYPWFLWPLFGWGIWLAKQGLAVVQAQSAAGRELNLEAPNLGSRAGWTREEQHPATPDPAARPWPDLE